MSDPSRQPAPPLPAQRNKGLPALLVGTGLVGVLVFVILLVSNTRPEPPLPVLATLPDFELISSQGESVRRSDLAGAPWIADLIFTSCSGVCPRMTSEMARIEERSRDQKTLRFVSISVDPERDTPEALAAYAAKLGAQRDRWLFLTGDRTTIFDLAHKGFLLPAQEGDPARGEEIVIHSSRFALVDSQGRLRGTYDARDPEALLRLHSDMRRVESAPTA